MFTRFLSIVALAIGLAHPAVADEFERKVALVIGNGAYENATPLMNPVRDAKAIALLLKDLGFETVEGYDLDRDGMTGTLRQFARATADADLTLFYYAGHGIGFSGRNYLVPVDARFEDATALDFEAMPVDFVTKQMRYADGVSLVFLDACRDNPLAGTLSRSLGLSTRSALSRGLAQMDLKEAGRGLAIAFATSPGEVAYDGAGQHSPFTTALLEHLATPDTDITQVMSRVTGDVLRATEDRQRPWLNASLTGPVILNPKPAILGPVSQAPLNFVPVTPKSEPSADELQAQTLLFNLARQSGLVSDYEAYLARFPDGLYAYNARQALYASGSAGVRATARPTEDATAAEATPPVAADPPPTLVGSAPANDIAEASVPEAGGGPVVASLAPQAGIVVPDGSSPAAEAADLASSDLAPVDATLSEAATSPATSAAPAVAAVAAVVAAPASAETEGALGLNRSARRALQMRLNIAGSDVGGADGVFGPRTRAGIRAWQEREGYPATGFINGAQLAALETATETEYAAILAERQVNRQARTAPARTTNRARASAPRKTTRRATTRRTTTKRRATTTQRRAAPKRTTTRRKTVARAPARQAPKTASRAKTGDHNSWAGRRRLNAAQMSKATRQARDAGLFK